jgi:hypothetical protein
LRIKNYKKFVWEARVPKCGEICGIFTTDIIHFIEETVKWRLGRLSITEVEDIAEDMFKEFSIGTFDMICEKEVGVLNAETVARIISDEKYRERIRRLMKEEEIRGYPMTEKDIMKNMKVNPESFVNYLAVHNVWIMKDIFPEFKKMYSFKSFSNYVRKYRNMLGIKLYLLEDENIKTKPKKKEDMKSITIYRNKSDKKILKQKQVQV